MAERKKRNWEQYTDTEMAKRGELAELHQMWNESIARQHEEKAEAERQLRQRALMQDLQSASNHMQALSTYENDKAETYEDLARKFSPANDLFGSGKRTALMIAGEERKRRQKQDWLNSFDDEALDAEIQNENPGYEITTIPDLLTGNKHYFKDGKITSASDVPERYKDLTDEKKRRESTREIEANKAEQDQLLATYEQFSDEDLEKRSQELAGNNWAMDPDSEAHTKELNEIQKVQEIRERNKAGEEQKNAKEEYQAKREKILSEAYAKGENVEALLNELVDTERGLKASAYNSINGIPQSVDAAEKMIGSKDRVKEIGEELKQLGVDNVDVLRQYIGEKKDEAETEAIMQKIREDILKKGGAAEAGYTALDVISEPFSGLLAAGESVRRNFYADPETVNTSSPLYMLKNMQNTIEQATNESIAENARTNWGAKVRQMAYGVGMSTAKSMEMAALGSAISAGAGLTGTAARVTRSLVTLPAFGTDAYATTLKEQQDRGVPTERAQQYAIMSGVNEMLFEVLSMDKIYGTLHRSGKTAAKDVVLDLLANAGIEGTEEGMTDIANMIADNLINKGDSDYNRLVKDLMDQGYSMDDAKREADRQTIAQVGEDVFAGMLSGGLAGSGGNVYSAVRNNHVAEVVSRKNPEVFEQMREVAKKSDPESVAYEIANSEKATEELTKEEKGSILTSLSEQQEGNVQTVIEDRLVELGESKEQAKEGAEEILAAATTDPEEVSEEESDARAERFTANENLSTVYGELERGEVAPVQQAVAAVERAYDTRKNTMDNVKSVQTDSNGNYVLKLKNGSTVRPENMNIPEKDYNTRMVMSWAMDASTPQEATQILQNHPEGMPYQMYRTAFEGIKRNAMEDVPLKEIERSFDQYTSMLAPKQIEAIYNLGVDLALQKAEKNLTEEQLKAVDTIAKTAGVTVQVGGKSLLGSNGAFGIPDNTIYVSDKTLNPAVVVTFHELVHSIKYNAQDLYDRLKRSLVDFWRETDPAMYKEIYENRGRRYKDQVKEWREAGKSEKEIEELIEEEIVAHSTEALAEKWGKMSQNEREDAAMRIAEKDRNLAERILDFVRDLLEKFKKALQGYKATSLEARTLRENIELLENFEDVFMNVLQEYGERNKAAGQTGELVDARGQEASGQQSEERKSLKEVGEDSEGKKLTSDQIEYFKDSKIVDEQGRLKVMYHGTQNEFYVFDPKTYGGKNGKAEGYGIYLSDSEDVMEAYGAEHGIKGYVNIKRPASAFEKTIKEKELIKLVRSISEKEARQMVDDGEYDTVKEALPDTWISNYVYTHDMSLEDAYKETAGRILKQSTNDADVVYTIMNDTGVRDYEEAYDFYETLQDTLGIDGIITEWTGSNGEKTNIVVAFNSYQIKLVTNEHPTEDVDIRYSIKELPDGETYVQLDGNLYDDGHGGRLTDVQAYDKLVNTIKYILLDGEKVFFIKYLKNKFDSKSWDMSMRKELMGKWPFNTDGISDMQTLNDKINENIVELLSRSEMEPFGKDAPDEDGKHAKYGIESFDNRFIRFADENDTYRLELTIAKLDDGRKIAYSKKTIERDPLLKRKIEEGTQGVIPIAPTSKKTIPSSKKKSNNNFAMFSKKELDEIDEVFEAEAKRLKDMDFNREMAEISWKEQKTNFDAKKDWHIFKTMATELAKHYDSAIDRDDLALMLFKMTNHWVNQGNKANFNDILRSMVGIARPIMDQTKTVDNSTKQDYENLIQSLPRRIRLTSTQKEELRSSFGSLHKFTGKFLGHKVVFADDGVPLDSVWEELVQQSGYLLNEDESEGGMPEAILNAMEALKPKMGLGMYKEAGMDENEMAIDIALDIYGRFMKTVAAKTENAELKEKIQRITNNRIEYREDIKKEYQRKYEQLKRESKAKIERQQEILEWELEKKEEQYKISRARHDEKQAEAHKKSIEYYKKKLEETRQNRDEKILELRARYRNNNVQRKINQEIQQKRASVIKTAKSIGTLLSTNTDKKHVPEALKQPTMDFLSGVQYFGTGHDGPETKAELEWADRLEKIKNILGDEQKAGTNLYFTVMDGDENGTPTSSLLADMKRFIDEHGKERMMEMDVNTLNELNDLMRGLKRAIDNMNQLYVNKRAENVAQLGDETIRELSRKKPIHNMTKPGKVTNELLNVSQLDAGSYFRRFGEAGKSIYRGFRDAQNSWIRMNGEAMDYMKELIGKTDIRKWATEYHDFEFGGRKVTFTTAQIMSLYELMKRKQAEEHIIFGGIKPADFQKGLVTVTQDRVRVTPTDVAKITDVLTDEQKRIADGIERFMNVNAANWGNKTTMLLYGYRRFLAKDYFPISVDKDTTDLRDTKVLNRVRSYGWTKETKEHARNALMARDIFDVFTEHVSQMATYSAYSPALMDARKWYDYRLMPDSEILEENPDVNPTIQGQIRRTYGADMLKYFKNLIADINNERKADTAGTGFYDMFLSNAKVAAIAGNVRVVIQQPTAYARALAVMDPKYLLKAVFTPGGAKRAIEHSAIAKWKSDGHWETGIASSMKSEITGQKTLRENINEKLLWMAGKADDLTWGKLWNAVELEMKDKHPTMDPKSKRFYKLCEERFDDVIDQTQVVDTTLHRSQLMRSKNGIVKELTAFMAEPTKSYNLLMNRARDWYEAMRMGDKKAAKQAAGFFTRAAGAFLFTAALNAAAQSLWDAVRGAGDEPEDIDDPKEKWTAFWERFIEAYIENITDNVNPLNLIPYAKDLTSILSGYTSNNLNAQGLEKTVTGVKKLQKWFTDPEQRKKTTFYDAAKPLIQGLSYIGGNPFYNVMRDTVAVIETLTGKKVGGRVYTATQQKERLADAALEGDMERYNEIVDQMRPEGEADTEFDEAYKKSTLQGMNSRYKVNDISDEDYIEALKNIGMSDDEAWFELKEQKHKKETGEKSYSAYRVLADPLLSGDMDAFEKIKKEYMEHGMEEEKIKSNTARFITEQVKAEIEAGTLDADAQAKYLTMYQKLGYDRDKKLKDIKKWRSGED